ncbi:MAG: acetylxylan esterase, partial [Opitutaceae bacterium]|nr:acetylxylan esterase [Opitutaceae bacterium]
MNPNDLLCTPMSQIVDHLKTIAPRPSGKLSLSAGVLRASAWFTLVLALVAGSSGMRGQTPAAAPDPLRVLGQGVAKRGEGPLRDFLRKETLAALDVRRKAYEGLKNADDIKAYQNRLHTHFVESLGGFPERTPLNARVTGELRGEGFRVEKILFESQPGFVVSGLLYLPLAGKAPFPAVLMPCGHSSSGKAAYQAPAMALATHGFAVFCFDPIGQGERLQVRHEARRREGPAPKAASDPTNEHTVLAAAPIVLGRNLATDMIWDGMRAIDYLETRPDIDAKRIACAGNSGGGLMTSYMIALEPRLVAATPGCFITTSARKNEHPGPGG